MTKTRFTYLIIAITTAFLVISCSSPLQAEGSGSSQDASRALATNNSAFTANVMAPLKVTDWAAFEEQIRIAKSFGVDAVSVDVWWGDVESGSDNSFDWSYYDTLFSKIKAANLKIVPILSFHQCGGNVGDSYTSLLPSWLWGKYASSTLNGITIGSNGLKHKSEQGNYSSETVQGWADTLVLNEYADFATAFRNRYGATYANDIQEINVSLGPAGELRYPSYNSHDSGTGYPTRGALQAYSTLAVKSFQTWAIAKYGSLAGVNAAWGTSLASTAAIQPPSNAATFFSSGDYRNIAYGKDFVDWYNQSLVDHGKRVVDAVIAAVGASNFPSAKIGFKIPGVHWTMGDPTYPRAAEVAAGLVQTSVDMNSDATGHGYANIVNLANQIAAGGRQIVLHFTCLEMSNQNYAPQYSRAQDLVFWVAQKAQASGVAIKGENALSGGVQSDAGWNNIVNAFDYAPYVGFTVLRVGDVVSGTGLSRYQQFIARYRSMITLKMTKDVGYGYSVYFTGSPGYLTSWGGGVAGRWTAGNVWTLDIPAQGNFEWKVRKGPTTGTGNQWESGANHNQANLWPAFNGGF